MIGTDVQYGYNTSDHSSSCISCMLGIDAKEGCNHGLNIGWASYRTLDTTSNTSTPVQLVLNVLSKCDSDLIQNNTVCP